MADILIIDDDPHIIDILKKTFKLYGYKVLSGTNGHDGIEHLKSNRFFTAVITDINMPVKDGNDVARHVRNIYKEKSPVVIGLSGFVENAEKELFDYLMPKPFKIKDLVQIVDKSHKPTDICKRAQCS
jgi:CheY-like chemotaxis protein